MNSAFMRQADCQTTTEERRSGEIMVVSVVSVTTNLQPAVQVDVLTVLTSRWPKCIYLQTSASMLLLPRVFYCIGAGHGC